MHFSLQSVIKNRKISDYSLQIEIRYMKNIISILAVIYFIKNFFGKKLNMKSTTKYSTYNQIKFVNIY